MSCNEETIVNSEEGFIAHYSEQSGIDFCNRLTESEEMNVVNYEYLYNGGGVGIGDFNNDGLQDVFLTGTMVPDQLFINKGSFKFEKDDFKGIDNSGFSTGVSIVDINADGLEDIYVCRTGKGEPDQRKNLLYINQGNLEFEEQGDKYGIASDHHTNHVAFFDFDRDGDLDLYVLNHPIDFKNSQKIRVQPSIEGGYERILHSKTEYDSDQLYSNNGDGTFTDISKEAGIDNYGFGLSVSIIDANGDDYPDIFVANDYIETDILYVNDQKGGFKRDLSKYFSHISENSMGSDWADINDDGLEDLIVVDMLAEDNFRQKTLVSSMSHERYHTLKNLSYKPQHMRNMVQLNNGVGAFSEVAHLLGVSNTDWSWAPLTIDFDNDGLKDLFISNGYRRDLSDCDYTLYKSDSLSKANIQDIQEYLENIPETPVQNYLYKNKGNLQFEKYSDKWNLTDKTYSNGSAFADFNNDGLLDLVVNNVDTFPIIYENRTTTNNHYLRVQLNGPLDNIAGIGTKVKLHSSQGVQVVRVTPNRGYFSSVLKEAHFGLGEYSDNIDSLVVDWPDGKQSVVRNLQVDSTYNIDYKKVEKHMSSNRAKELKSVFSKTKKVNVNFTHIENEYDDLRAQHLLPHCLSNFGPKLCRSPKYIYCGGSFGQKSIVIDNNGKEQKLEGTELTEDLEAVFFDYDNDGDQDLYVVAGGNAMPLKIENYTDKLYQNVNGTFKLTSDVLPQTQSSGASATALDFDKDGDMDLFVGGRVLPGNYPYSPLSYLFENRSGKFYDVTEEKGQELKYGGMISDCAWADIDGDNSEELVLCGEYLPISVFKFNDENQFEMKEIVGLENTNGWWNTMEMFDIDNDGDLDILAGNLGQNAKYKCSENKPYILYAKDFDGNGRVDPIACQYIGDESYPIPARGDLLKQLPVLQRRLKNYRKYANCQIGDLFSEEELNQADKYVAKTFASCYFENTDEGFVKTELPIESQFAPIYAIQAFRANNKTYVITGGNNTQVHVESGPYDAGRVNMYEHKGGRFVKIPLPQLGIDIESEVRSFLYDNNQLSVGINNGKLQSYRINSTNL